MTSSTAQPFNTKGRHSTLVKLGRWLADRRYCFIAPTPATHARVIARDGERHAANLEEIFGWSRRFNAALLPDEVLGWMREADVLELDADANSMRSTIRFSSLDGRLFMHSSWPTIASNAVFFGPDTYRFARFVQANLPPVSPHQTVRLCDVGCGSGAVGLTAARWLGPGTELHLLDINGNALDAARVNAELAGASKTRIYASDLLQSIQSRPDVVICNPPYLPDAEHRLYRDGGNDYGSALSLRLVHEALQLLASGGRLLLYTGTAVIAGKQVLARPLLPMLEEAGRERRLRCRYEELDPDVFGEELELPSMADVERIAVVGLSVQIAT